MLSKRRMQDWSLSQTLPCTCWSKNTPCLKWSSSSAVSVGTSRFFWWSPSPLQTDYSTPCFCVHSPPPRFPSPRPVSSMCSTRIGLKLAHVRLTDVSAHSRAQRKRCWFGTRPGRTESQRGSPNPRSGSKMKHEILNTEPVFNYSINARLIIL